MDFELNPAKAVANLAKHGVDFPTARRVFDDPMMLSEIDPRNYCGETGLRAVGSVDSRVLTRLLHDARRAMPHHQRQESKSP